MFFAQAMNTKYHSPLYRAQTNLLPLLPETNLPPTAHRRVGGGDHAAESDASNLQGAVAAARNGQPGVGTVLQVLGPERQHVMYVYSRWDSRCDHCSDRFLALQGPAWYPKNVGRAERLFRIWLAKSSDPHHTSGASLPLSPARWPSV